MMGVEETELRSLTSSHASLPPGLCARKTPHPPPQTGCRWSLTPQAA